jgi:hypothetical protein
VLIGRLNTRLDECPALCRHGALYLISGGLDLAHP